MRKPSNNTITLPFGSTLPPYSASSPHKGTDFSYLPDNKIYAPFGGKVSQIPNNGNDGNGTYMTDPQGRFHGFLHASKYLVSNGSYVQEGQAIAIMGETGFAQGVHLHWAVKQNGVFIDPMSIISSEGGDMPDYIKAPQHASLWAAYFNRAPTKEEVDRDVGKKTYESMVNELDQSSEFADKKKRDQQAYDALNNSNVQPYNGPQLFVEKDK